MPKNKNRKEGKIKMLKFKIDVLKALKEKGYSSYEIAKSNKIGISASALQDIRKGKVPGTKTINSLCKLLNLQPGSIIKYVPDPEKEDGSATD